MVPAGLDLDEPFESSFVPRALAPLMGEEEVALAPWIGEEEEPGAYGGEGGGMGDLQGTFL